MLARLRIFLAIVLLVPLLVWGGFRFWLHQQDPAFRASIESFSTIEFFAVLRQTFLPTPPEDRAGYGRRTYPGRGASPWAIRSSLDGRPRMLSLALGADQWLAYSTETASIHQLWHGDIDFTGPVYDARHGAEPTSRGLSYLRAPAATAWRVFEDGSWQPAKIRWLGHGFEDDGATIWLRYEVIDARGEAREVVEWPDFLAPDARPASDRDGRIGLSRRFVQSEAPGPAIAIVVDGPAGPIETDGTFDRDGSLLVLEDRETRSIQWFGPYGRPIVRSAEDEVESGALAKHDCHTCHSERERIVGPAWSEIALRYAGMNPSLTADRLARRIREGSAGEWGTVAMIPHPDIELEESLRVARWVLSRERAEAPVASVEDGGVQANWSFGFQTEPRPETLHPSLSVHAIEVDGFTPLVAGLAFLPDGRLAVSTWDPDGAVFAVDGWRSAGSETGAERENVRVERIAEGLHEPLGLAVVDDALYVMQKQEITRLVDRNGDGTIDEYRTIANDWRVTSNFHEFGFGLVALDRHLYGSLSVCVLRGGKSCRVQTPDRGRLFRYGLDSGRFEFLASGLRTPNGLAPTPDGSILITDNQGDWLPASKLIRWSPGDEGSWYGWRAPGDARDLGKTSPPALWLAQNEIGNSPTQPLVLSQGPYAGQILFGDIFNGGLKRAALEEIGGYVQGAAFHFSGGLEAPVNRLIEAPDGTIVVGEIGSDGNWGEFGKRRFGLEVLRFDERMAFEPLRVAATSQGFDVHFSRPLADDFALAPDQFEISQWFYVPSEIYGGPKYGEQSLSVRALELSEDRRVASLAIDGLKEGHIVYLHLDRAIRSNEGESLWVNEAWYTLNARPVGPSRATQPEPEPTALAASPRLDPRPARPPVETSPPNQLTAAEREDGWRLLFDGKSFEGWKNYGAPNDAIEGWVIRDAAFEFTRDVSFAGLLWHHITPWNVSALDLMTKERFENFELSIDWKLSEGGNSGIFYAVPDEEASLPWTYGMEMQVLDDARHPDGQLEKRRAGDLYDLVASAVRAARPIGEWNTARIRVDGDRIEHWLNDQKLLEIVRGSEAWNRAVAESKFDGTPGMGLARRGHITLQDHGDVAWYRNIKIREWNGESDMDAQTSAGGGPRGIAREVRSAR
jgi:cytochrome c551/c552